VKFGSQLVQFQAGLGIQVAAPEDSKYPFGVRATAIVVSSKK
jgi:hypothetical protein